MERRHFRLPVGYLNVDEAGLAFTRSGNWEHARKATVWRAPVLPGKVARILSGLLLLGFFGVFLLARKDWARPSTLLLNLGLLAGALFFRYLRIADGFRTDHLIPWSWISETTWSQGRLSITIVPPKGRERVLSYDAPVEAWEHIREWMNVPLRSTRP